MPQEDAQPSESANEGETDQTMVWAVDWMEAKAFTLLVNCRLNVSHDISRLWPESQLPLFALSFGKLAWSVSWIRFAGFHGHRQPLNPKPLPQFHHYSGFHFLFHYLSISPIYLQYTPNTPQGRGQQNLTAWWQSPGDT